MSGCRRASLALLNVRCERRLLGVLRPRRLRQVCVLGPARVDCSLARVQLWQRQLCKGLLSAARVYLTVAVVSRGLRSPPKAPSETRPGLAAAGAKLHSPPAVRKQLRLWLYDETR